MKFLSKKKAYITILSAINICLLTALISFFAGIKLMKSTTILKYPIIETGFILTVGVEQIIKEAHQNDHKELLKEYCEVWSKYEHDSIVSNFNSFKNEDIRRLCQSIFNLKLNINR